MDPSAAGAGGTRRRAEQFLNVAEKLLEARDLEGCKQFSYQALAVDPNTPGAEDLHAAASVLLAAERRRLSNGTPDPYAVLGLDPANPASRHPDAINSHYRRVSFLLNRSRPDRSFSFAFTNAAQLVADALCFLSDPIRKSSLDADLAAAAAAAAAAARAYQSPAANRQTPLPARPNPPFAILSPRQTPPPAASPPRPTPPPSVPSPRPTAPSAARSLRPTPPPAARSPRPTPPPAAPPRPTPPPAAPSPRPTPRAAFAPGQTLPSASPAPTPVPVASPPRSQPPRAASPLWPAPLPAVSPPQPTPAAAGTQTRPTPPAPAPQTPVATMVPPAASGTPSSSTFWTVCTACSHIHQYDRLYETRKLLCPSCRQSFVAKAMDEPPPIVPGTDMYYCTWGFFPVGFPGCPGFERFVNSQPQGPDQLNAPWLRGSSVVKGNAGDAGVRGNAGDADVKGNAVNGVPVSSAAVIPVEVPATTPPAKPMRVKAGAKKCGRPKGSKNKNKF